MAPSGVSGGGAGGEGGGGAGAAPVTMEAVLTEVDKRVGAKIEQSFTKFQTEGLNKAFEDRLAPIMTTLTGVQEMLGKLTPQNAGGGSGAGAGAGATSITPEMNVVIKDLKSTTENQGKMIETLKREKQEADARAEKSERTATIKGALNNINFISEEAAKTAFGIVDPFVKRMDDGSLIGGVDGDNLPLDNFVKEHLTKVHPYLLRASGASGSGASGANNLGSRMAVKADLNDIKIGMKPETRQAVIDSIGMALNGL
jgi:hypothetical protein